MASFAATILPRLSATTTASFMLTNRLVKNLARDALSAAFPCTLSAVRMVSASSRGSADFST